MIEQDIGTSKDTVAVEEASPEKNSEQAHRNLEATLGQLRMKALLNAKFSLMEELKAAKTTEHKELESAYQNLEAAFQAALIAEGEIQRGKE